MFKRALPFILVIFFVLVDTSVIPFLTRGAYAPLLALCTVMALGLLLGRTRGTLLGLIAGTLIDVLVSTPLGVMMALYTFSGYIAGVAGRKFQRYIIAPVVAPLFCLIVTEAAMMIYQYLAGVQIAMPMVYQAGARALIEVALVQIFYLLYNRILRPKWSRYAK